MNIAIGDQSETQQVEESRFDPKDPLELSIVGEYARLLMIGTATCSGFYWASRIGSSSTALVMVLVAIFMLGVLTTHRFAGLIRLSAELLVLIGLAGVVGLTGDWTGPIPFFSPAALLCCLAVLSARDLVVALGGRRFRSVSVRKVVVWGAISATLAYLVIVPTIDIIAAQFVERPDSIVIKDLSSLEFLRIRSVKLIVFSIFAYVGACVGSFLNVLAVSAPRGEPVMLRSSACPQCKTPIRRIDNLPIISYLRLRGKCRSCAAEIPFRYFAVELIALSVFASLFLYELVTGAANVPGFRHYIHTGVVWMVLFTKWPVVAIFFYHAILFCCLLTLALMEIDGQRCPRFLAMGTITAFALLSVFSPTLQTVAFDDQLPISVSSSFPPWLTRLITCLVGAAVGFLVSILARFAGCKTVPWIAFALLGVTLGWQATVTIGVIWGIASLGLAKLSVQTRANWLGPTAILFCAAMIHHPAWKLLAQLW